MAAIRNGAKTPGGVRATQERRRSGASGIHHDRRLRRARTRGAQRHRAIHEHEG